LRTRRYLQGGDTYPARPLMKVDVSGAAVSTPAMPVSLATRVTFPDSEVVQRRTMVFTEKDKLNEFFINGKEFDPNRVDAAPKLGTVEEWTLVNGTMEQHPFHIHVNDFRVLSVGGQAYPARGTQDTVILHPMQPVVVRIPFDDFTGKFVFHCHIMNHGDSGMMALVDVVE
jgi:FtsP/CotA-like multicopper oxidase with cupredoxin domain